MDKLTLLTPHKVWVTAPTAIGSKDTHLTNNLSLKESHNNEGDSLEVDLDKLKQQLGLSQIVKSMETMSNLLQVIVAKHKAELPSFQHTKKPRDPEYNLPIPLVDESTLFTKGNT